MLNLFATKVEALRNRTNAALDIFTKTKNDLEQINAEIATERSKKEEELATIQKDINLLDNLTTGNLKVIGKIDKLFE